MHPSEIVLYWREAEIHVSVRGSWERMGRTACQRARIHLPISGVGADVDFVKQRSWLVSLSNSTAPLKRVIAGLMDFVSVRLPRR